MLFRYMTLFERQRIFLFFFVLNSVFVVWSWYYAFLQCCLCYTISGVLSVHIGRLKLTWIHKHVCKCNVQSLLHLTSFHFYCVSISPRFIFIKYKNMMFKKCWKIFWCTLSGFNYMKTVNNLFNNPSFFLKMKLLILPPRQWE